MKNLRKFSVFLVLAFALSIASEHFFHASPIAHAAAQTAKQVTQKDFFGKWKLSASTLRKAPGEKNNPGPELIAEATAAQQMNTDLLTAFDYLEIRPDGSYNWHQPGDPVGGKCVWCGKWKFQNNAIWLDTPSKQKLGLFSKDGNLEMEMTYEAEANDLHTKMYLYYFKRIK